MRQGPGSPGPPPPWYGLDLERPGGSSKSRNTESSHSKTFQTHQKHHRPTGSGLFGAALFHTFRAFIMTKIKKHREQPMKNNRKQWQNIVVACFCLLSSMVTAMPGWIWSGPAGRQNQETPRAANEKHHKTNDLHSSFRSSAPKVRQIWHSNLADTIEESKQKQAKASKPTSMSI